MWPNGSNPIFFFFSEDKAIHFFATRLKSVFTGALEGFDQLLFIEKKCCAGWGVRIISAI